MIADVAQEAGYVRAAEFGAKAGRCTLEECSPAFARHGQRVQSAQAKWPELLAHWASADDSSAWAAPMSHAEPDPGLVLGWALHPRA